MQAHGLTPEPLRSADRPRPAAERSTWTVAFGSVPLTEVAVDDVHATNRISAAISVFGALAGVLLLGGGVRGYRSGASALWIAVGAVILFSALCSLVRDVRRLRAGPTV